MNFIKKILDKKVDNNTHLQFQKFSKGEFRNKALIEAKNSGGKCTIKTSSEFANEMIRIAAEKLGGEKAKVTGAMISTSDLTGKIDFKDKKQFQGVKKYLLDKEMSGNEIISMLNEFPKTFFALSFSAEKDNTQLKIKPKAPKSAKPGKGGDSPKADFCVLKTTDPKIGESFVFEKPSFKSVEINHVFLIDSIVIPDELSGSNDFARIREESRRKGRILRKAVIDGERMDQEIEFLA